MLNKSDLVFGTVIAPKKLRFHPSAILTNLEEMISLTGDESTYQTQALEQSCDPEFINVAETVAETLGVELRTSAVRIKEHVIPVLRDIQTSVESSFNQGRILEKTISGLEVQYACVDHSFLNSVLYPEGRKSTNLNREEFNLLKNFPLGMISEGADGGLTNAVVEQFIVKHPDVMAFMDEPDDFRAAIERAHSREWWQQNFSRDGVACDFTRIQSFRLSQIFGVYIVLSKIRATETLLFPVANISLTDYRELINDLWESLNVYLPALRIMCNNYRQDGLVIRNSSKFSLVNREINGVRIKVLTGNCDVLYSTAYVNLIDNHNSSLAEVLANYILHIIENNGVPKVSPNGFVADEGTAFCDVSPLTRLLNENSAAHGEHLNALIKNAARSIVSRKLMNMGVEEFSLNDMIENIYVSSPSVERTTVNDVDIGWLVMSSCIGSKLLELMGFFNAARLLRYTRSELESGEGNTKAVARAYARFAVHYLTRDIEELKG